MGAAWVWSARNPHRDPHLVLFSHPLGAQRFGSALVPSGHLQLKKKQFQKDFGPVDPDCSCPTCRK